MGCGASKSEPVCVVCNNTKTKTEVKQPYHCLHVVCLSCVKDAGGIIPIRCLRCDSGQAGTVGDLCQQHNLEFVYYCDRHKELTCRECHRIIHAAHCEVTPINEFVRSQTYRDMERCLFVRFEAREAHVRGVLTKLEGTSQGLLSKEISIVQEIKTVREMVEKRMRDIEERVIQEAKSHREKETATLLQQHDKCKHTQVEIQRSAKKLNTMVPDENDVQRMKRYLTALKEADARDDFIRSYVDQIEEVELHLQQEKMDKLTSFDAQVGVIRKQPRVHRHNNFETRGGLNY